MNAVIPPAAGPAEMRIVGSFRLAQAIHDGIGKRDSVSGVCAYLLELLPALLDADAMSIELTCSTVPAHFRMPIDFFVDLSGGLLQAAEVVTPLIAKGNTIGRICLYYTHESSERGPQGQALLDFVGGCLSRVVSESMTINSRLSTLTAAERKVLSLFSVPTDQILETLHISRETLRVHCRHIFKKLGVHNRQEAMLVARPGAAGEAPSQPATTSF